MSAPEPDLAERIWVAVYDTTHAGITQKAECVAAIRRVLAEHAAAERRLVAAAEQAADAVHKVGCWGDEQKLRAALAAYREVAK